MGVRVRVRVKGCGGEGEGEGVGVRVCPTQLPEMYPFPDCEKAQNSPVSTTKRKGFTCSSDGSNPHPLTPSPSPSPHSHPYLYILTTSPP